MLGRKHFLLCLQSKCFGLRFFIRQRKNEKPEEEELYYNVVRLAHTQSCKQPCGAWMGVDVLEVRGQLPAALELPIGEEEFFLSFPKGCSPRCHYEAAEALTLDLITAPR